MNKQLKGIDSPLIIFYSYANEDELLRDELEKHLSLLRRQGVISTWYNRQITPGAREQQEIDAHLDLAAIILLLISPDFLASDYCYSVEMKYALDRHATGDAYVIPIILRPVDWQDAPFSSLQGLPRDLKPVTTWENQDEAFLDIARGIRWTAKHLLGEAESEQRLLSADQQAASLAELAPKRPSFENLRNRQRFLAYLNTRYREVFAQSLQGTALIPLDMRTAPEAIEQFPHTIFHHLHQEEQIVPEGTSIVDLYDQAAGELLVLGEPGAGKSILLLHLAENLCQKAEKDALQPLPVILNLSSWAQKPRLLANWLIEELFLNYQVPRKIAQQWVQDGQIVPLLDGLDEVVPALRGSCIDAINAYRRDYFVPLVVCSRTGDYLIEQRRLIIQKAIIIQPLNSQKIENFLLEPDLALIEVQNVLQQNSGLRELATSPLMLNILAITYRNTIVKALPSKGSPEEQQRLIFANYLKRVLPPDKALQHTFLSSLSWLAQQLHQRNQTVFYLEQLQPDWLPGTSLLQAYELLGVRLPSIMLGIFISLMICTFLLFSDASSFIMYALLGGIIGGVLSHRLPLTQKKRYTPFWQTLLVKIGISICVGIVMWKGFNFLFGIGGGLYSLLLQVFLRTSGSLTRVTQRFVLQKRIRFVIIYNSLLSGLFAWLIFGFAEIEPLVQKYLAPMAPTLPSKGGGYGGGGDTTAYFASLLMHHTFEGFNGLGYGVSFAVVVAILSTLLIDKSIDIQVADRLSWSWHNLIICLLRVRHIMTSLSLLMLIDICMSLGILINVLLNLELQNLFFAIQTRSWASFNMFSLGSEDIVISNISYAVSAGLSAGIGFGVAYWLLIGLFKSVESQAIPQQSRIVPNEGIHRSFFNSLWSGLANALIVGIICFICFYLDVIFSIMLNLDAISRSSPLSTNDTNTLLGALYNNALVTSLIVGLSAFVVGGLLTGGQTALRHYLIRIFLHRTGLLPWKLPRFLEAATRYILLRKIGNGYTFIHQLIRDYIVSLEKSD